MAEKTYDQYEIWVDNRGKWERVAFFRHFDVASAVFSTRSYRQRLIHATYDEQGRKLAEDTVAEIGRTREAEHHPPRPAPAEAPTEPARRSRFFPKRKAS